MADFGLGDLTRFMRWVVREENPILRILRDGFDGFGAGGVGAEFREVGNDDFVVTSWVAVIFEKFPFPRKREQWV